MLCDLDFYKSSYYGSKIPDAEFAKYEAKAEDQLHPLTFDRLAAGLPSDELAAQRVKKAVCALCDLLFDIDAETQARSSFSDGIGIHGAVASITAGSESIHYSTSAATDASKSAGDSAYRTQIIYKTVLPYLMNVTDDSGVNLLYAGD